MSIVALLALLGGCGASMPGATMRGAAGSFQDAEFAADLVAGPSDEVFTAKPAPASPIAGASMGGARSATFAASSSGGSSPTQATDAIDPSGPMLVYTAEIVLAIFDVDATQEKIIAALDELGGFMSFRNRERLQIRVPAAKFRQALEVIEASGDVIGRQVTAEDVGEEFRDVAIRLKNAIAMRDRLEQLLAKATKVEDALAIERELHRLTDVIEKLKGRQRYLADRIAFSTITVHFQSRATEAHSDHFNLPFPWLRTLGIANLLNLQ